MKKQIIYFLLLLLGLTYTACSAQERKWEDIDTTGFYKKQVIARDGFELTFINKASEFDTITGQRLIELFFRVYPQEVMRFNRKASRKVTFVISSEWKGFAATIGTVIKFDPSWLEKNPQDIDCATHELMHVVQAYHSQANPGWLVEGIADYGREAFGINNKNAGWGLTAYRHGQLYTDAYCTTARFLVWTEKRYNKNLVKKLDEDMREGKYTDKLWVNLTGKTVDELWHLYGVDPAV
jgi:hypothetical protein